MKNTQRNRISLILASGVILSVVCGCKPPGAPQSQPETPRNTSTVKIPDVDLTKEGPSDAEIPEEFITTPSGLKYRILRKTDGDKPNEFSIATISQRGWLDDDREFENSYRLNKSFTVAMDKLLPGIREGISLVGEGGKIELVVPYQIGYGSRGFPPKIPAGATLHYIIELHSFK